MIVMAIVKAAYPTHLSVSLPGRLVGKVPITHISRSYSKLLQTVLENQDLTTVSHRHNLYGRLTFTNKISRNPKPWLRCLQWDKSFMQRW